LFWTASNRLCSEFFDLVIFDFSFHLRSICLKLSSKVHKCSSISLMFLIEESLYMSAPCESRFCSFLFIQKMVMKPHRIVTLSCFWLAQQSFSLLKPTLSEHE
jgi:hypothetical protein